MIAKILKPVKGFSAIRYNLNKVDTGKAELMKVANFGALEMMGRLRSQDYQDYFMQLAALNKRVVNPQFHAVISSEGRSSTKEELTVLAEAWLKEMGYSDQPYMIVFHKDTEHNHVHIVSSRVDKNGRKISSAFEHNRSIRALNKLTGLNEDETAKKDLKDALSYRFSTKAQFAMILEARGYVVRDRDLIKFGKKQLTIPNLSLKLPDKQRATQLRTIFEKYRKQYSTELRPQNNKAFTSDFATFMKVKFGIELVFHASEGKPPYGYTVIDHAQKNVFKGGEVLSLKALLDPAKLMIKQEDNCPDQPTETSPKYEPTIRINIADDVDDQQIHGMRRHRQRKARTNTR